MRHRIENNLLPCRLVRVAVAAFLLVQSGAFASPVKHYGYSGQDRMPECIHGVFGKYAAAFPGTVLYGHPPVDDSTMKVVNGYWQFQFSAKLTF